MGNKGYIKLHRQIQDCWIWSDGEKYDKAHAFIDLLISANHRDRKIAVDGKPKIITRGQFLTSELKLAQRWNWDRKTVHKYLKVLENDKMVTLEQSHVGTTISIVNYSIYQDSMDNDVDSGMDNGMDSGMDTNKNNKECKEDIKEKNNKKENANSLFSRLASEYDFTDHMMQSLTEWFEYKTERKEKFVEMGMRKTLTLIQNKIEECGERYVIDVINNSMAHSWSGMIWDSVKPTTKANVPQNDLDFLNTDWHHWTLQQWSKAKEAGKVTDDDFRRIRKEVINGTV